MLKLKQKKQKFSMFPKLNRLYRIYKKLLKKDQEFNWSFLKFFFNTQLTDKYKINTVEFLSYILLCKINKWEKTVTVESSYISKEVFKNPFLCQSINIQLNEYKLLYGYDTIIISFKDEHFNKETKTLFFVFLDFKVSETEMFLKTVKNHTFDKIILSKTIQ